MFLKNPPENFQNENCNKSGRKLFKFQADSPCVRFEMDRFYISNNRLTLSKKTIMEKTTEIQIHNKKISLLIMTSTVLMIGLSFFKAFSSDKSQYNL